MDRLTESDRGNFLVTTQGSTHLWEITESHGDVHVSVTRNPNGRGHFSMDGFPNGRPYTATVKTWPEVGGLFLNIVSGGAGDIPWTRSSRIKSIERL